MGRLAGKPNKGTMERGFSKKKIRDRIRFFSVRKRHFFQPLFFNLIGWEKGLGQDVFAQVQL